MYDVIIIGGGIIGCAVARELSRYALRVAVVERGADIAAGATKANSGILHAGYDCKPDTLKASLNLRGLYLYAGLVRELEIPYRNNGAMVIDIVGGNGLADLFERGKRNGVAELELISGEAARRLEPGLSDDVKAAMIAPGAGVISPYEAAIAFAESAAVNGVEFLLGVEVVAVTSDEAGGFESLFEVQIADSQDSGGGAVVQTLSAKTVINAAGINSAAVNNMLIQAETGQSADSDNEAAFETIKPQRGQYYLLDNTQKNLVHRTIFQMPTHLGKGVLIAPTVDYNILLGPTAENGETSTDTTREGLEEALSKAALSLKTVPIADKITTFAGVRAKHESQDFVLSEPQAGFINAIGIDSPGLSAAPAIAERLAEMALARLQPAVNKNFIAHRPAIKRFRELSRAEQAALIAQNPAYGKIVCRCETITEAEIVEAIRCVHAPRLGAKNLDALKRRTRAQIGRCQGGFCTVRLMEILARELGVAEVDVTKNGRGTEMLAWRKI